MKVEIELLDGGKAVYRVCTLASYEGGDGGADNIVDGKPPKRYSLVGGLGQVMGMVKEFEGYPTGKKILIFMAALDEDVDGELVLGKIIDKN